MYTSLKFWFGTEFESQSPEEKHALLWGDDEVEEEEGNEAQGEITLIKRAPPIASSDADSDHEDLSKQDAEAKRRFDEAIEQDKKKLEGDPHTALDVLPYRQIVTAPVEFLQGSARGIIKDSVLSAAKRGGTQRPARLPPKGTPERAKIEAARKRGVRAKKAEELRDIQAGGRGSRVWTGQELEGIRRDRDFPLDAQWHHDPTVANRPDLAADPRVVHPLRG